MGVASPGQVPRAVRQAGKGVVDLGGGNQIENQEGQAVFLCLRHNSNFDIQHLCREGRREERLEPIMWIFNQVLPGDDVWDLVRVSFPPWSKNLYFEGQYSGQMESPLSGSAHSISGPVNGAEGMDSAF